MKIKSIFYPTLLLLVASFATAQVPRGDAAAPAPSTPAVADWPQFEYDAAHTSCNPNESILSPSTVSKLELDWKYTTGSFVLSSPAVANGTVFFGSWDKICMP